VALQNIHHLGAAFVEALFFLIPRNDALLGGIEFSSEKSRRLRTEAQSERTGQAIEPYRGCGRQGSWTAGQPERAGITTGPYRDSGSAPGGIFRRDRTEVSRPRSNPTPAVMGGTR
jgi:hypothetical protein